MRSHDNASAAIPRYLLRSALSGGLAILWLLVSSAVSQTSSLAAAPSSKAEHDRAVALARAGNLDAALRIFESLVRARPGDVGIKRDYMVVLEWAGQAERAVKVFESLPPNEPLFVLTSAAASYRRLHRWTDALNLYREAAAHSPGNPTLRADEALTLTDMGRAEDALRLTITTLNTNPRSIDLLLAAGYAEMARHQPVDALRYEDEVLRLAPENKDALRERVYAIDEMGASHVALGLARQHPALFSDADLRRLEGNDAAELVRFGPIEAASEVNRFAATDEAIRHLDRLIARWSTLGDAAKSDILRAHFDRVVALHDRVRMKEVVAEYRSLVAAEIEVPTYALVSIGDAFLYLHEPATARDIFEQVLGRDPHSFDAKIGLYYSLVESEDFDRALALIDSVENSTPKWIYLKGEPIPLPNPARETADAAAAEARLSANDLVEAERRFSRLADAAPANASFLGDLADVYARRAWPRQAQAEYQLGQALDPTDPGLAVAAASNELTLRNYALAQAQEDDLIRRYPERLDAQRLAEEVDLHNRPELRISIDRAAGSSAGVSGGQGVVADTEIFSPPIAFNWRLYADETIGHQHEPEGIVTLLRTAVGLEYRIPDLIATAAASYNTFGTQIDGTADKPGAAVTASWDVDDHWRVAGDGEIFAAETPLRALRNGITANSLAVAATYRESELRQVTLGPSLMKFSDGNVHEGMTGQYQERLFTSPHVTIDGVVAVGADHNTRADAPYYNPRLDLSTTVGAEITHILYRRYNFVYDQRLSIAAGPYWERNFGTSAAGSVKYEQRVRTSDAFAIGAGVSVGRQTYDGNYETSVDLLLDLAWKF